MSLIKRKFIDCHLITNNKNAPFIEIYDWGFVKLKSDLISEIVVAMNHGLGLGGIAASIHPYPTVADAIRRTGDQYNRTRLSPFNQKILNLLRKFNVGK